MKLRYIITTLVAAVALATSCQESLERHLAEVQVSSSYVAIPAAGGSKTITVTATADWTINDIPEWLTIKPVSGQAGETEVTFTSAAATSTNQTTVHLVCSGKTQEINVLQQTAKQELPISTCAQVNSGEDGKTYRIKGTVTRIVNTTYGNMYISDDTGEVYVYGTLDASGAEKNFLSLGIEAGDIVTVEGPRTTYGGVIELVNVTVIEIEKSLIKVESVEPAEALPLEGGTVTVTLTNKGDGIGVQIPEEAKSWLSVSAIASKGTTTMVGLEAAANEGGDRSVTVVFATASGDKDYTAQVELSQKGAIIDATVEEFLAAEEGDTQYRLTGVVTKISANSKYHNADITVSSGDFAHSVLLYRAVTAEGNIEDLGIKAGDIVTVVGKRSSYSGAAQMAAGGLCETVRTYAAASVAEFLAAALGEEYAVSGEITKVENLSPKSGYNNVNVTIKDGDNTLYLYRVTTFDKSDIAVLNPEVGGTIIVAGKRGEYKGNPQMGAGGVVLAYAAPAEDGGDDTPDVDAPTYTLTTDGLPTAYPTEETVVTLSGLECYILNVANYGSGIQIKKESGYLANKTALKKIKTIKVTVTDGKPYYPDNLKLYAGTAEKPEGTALTGTSDATSTTFDLSGGDYTYFNFKNTSGYAVYLGKIEITCGE